MDLEVLEISAEKSNPFKDKFNSKFFKSNKNRMTDLEKNLPNKLFDKSNKRDVTKLWTNKLIHAEWFNNSSTNIIPENLSKHLKVETMKWGNNKKVLSLKEHKVYRITLLSEPIDEKTKKRIPVKLELTHKISSESSSDKYSSQMSVGDKIVFLKIYEDGYSNMKVNFILPKEKQEENINPFATTAEIDPFAQNEVDPFADSNNEPENPLEEADRLERERLRRIRIAEAKARKERERVAAIQAEKDRIEKKRLDAIQAEKDRLAKIKAEKERENRGSIIKLIKTYR